MDPNLKEFIFSTHLLKLDHGGMVFLALLKMAAERGVVIKGVVDNRIGGANSAIYSYLASQRINIRSYNPIKLINFLTQNPLKAFKISNRRLHDKGWVAKMHIPDQYGGFTEKFIALAGDKNISADYFSMSRLLLPNHTTMNGREMVIEDSTLTQDIYDYLNNLFNSDSLVEKKDYKPDPFIAHGFQKQLAKYVSWIKERREKRPLSLTEKQWKRVVFDIPDEDMTFLSDLFTAEGRVSTYRQLLEALRNTPPGEEVLIENPYFVLEPELVETVKKLKSQGSKVIWLTNMPEYSDVSYIKYSNQVDLEKIAELGVDVYFIAYSNKITHAKMAIIGKKIVYNGSANFDPRSLNLNSELGELYNNEEFASYLTKRFWTRIMTSAVIGIQNGEIFYDKDFASFIKKENLVRKMIKFLSLGMLKVPQKNYTNFKFKANSSRSLCRKIYIGKTLPPKVSIIKRWYVEMLRPYL